MFETSEDAIEANEPISHALAAHELRRHGFRIVETKGARILVTNDFDEPEWIDCTTRAVMIWLGY